MIFFLRVFIFAVGLTGGLLLLRYLDDIVRLFGKNEWAEQRFRGGTYSVWQLVAIILMAGSFLLAFVI
jgi:hypothetical protein